MTEDSFHLRGFMLKKLLAVTVLAFAIATPLLAGGCASDNDKGVNGLTGSDHPAQTHRPTGPCTGKP
jgi:hypothetical protein